jgi:hypothetical protein
LSVLVNNGAARIKRGKTVPITWQALDNVGMTSQSIELSIDEGQTFEPIVVGLDGDARSHQWQVSEVLPKTRRAVVRVRSHDAAGNMGQASSKTFKLR